MGFQKCLCFDLRIGVLIYAGFSVIAGCFSVVQHLWLSVTLEDPKLAADNTFMLGGDFLHVAIVTCLIYGAYKERRMFMLPYLIIGCLGLAVLTVICIIFMFYTPFVIILLLLLGILWYIWFCVLSLYQMLDPHNPNYMPKSTTTATPDNTAFVESASPPPPYYDNKMAQAV